MYRVGRDMYLKESSVIRIPCICTFEMSKGRLKYIEVDANLVILSLYPKWKMIGV